MTASPTTDSAVAATLRRRAEGIAALGVLLAVLALVFADPRLAAPVHAFSEPAWPDSLPEIAGLAALLAALFTGLSASISTTRGVRGLVSFTALGVVVAAIYWLNEYSEASCNDRACEGLLVQTANWWAFWVLTVLAVGCAVLACRVGEDLGSR